MLDISFSHHLNSTEKDVRGSKYRNGPNDLNLSGQKWSKGGQKVVKEKLRDKHGIDVCKNATCTLSRGFVHENVLNGLLVVVLMSIYKSIHCTIVEQKV